MRQLISQAILAIWYAGMAAQGFAATRIAMRGLMRAYKVFFLFLVANLAEQVWLVYELYAHGNAGYRAAWTTVQPITIALLAAVTIEAFYLQARHFRRIRWFALLLATVFALIAAGVCAATSGIGSTLWPGVHHRLELLSRYYATGCLLFLGLSTAFFRAFESFILRPNVIRHLLILGLFLSNEILVFGVLYATAARDFAVMTVTQTMSVAIPLACYLIWAFVLTKQGEEYKAPETMSRGELEQLIEDDNRKARGHWG